MPMQIAVNFDHFIYLITITLYSTFWLFVHSLLLFLALASTARGSVHQLGCDVFITRFGRVGK